jgi:hypothetical protein
MGGVAGHMAHPHEIFELHPMSSFFHDLINNRFDIYEKVDGINLFAIFKGNTVKFARNKTSIPFDIPYEQYENTHPAYNSLVKGCNAIKMFHQEYLKRTTNPQTNFAINLEIINSDCPNLVQYNRDYIVFHSLHNLQNFERLTPDLEGVIFADLKNDFIGFLPVTYTGHDVDSVGNITEKLFQNTVFGYKFPSQMMTSKNTPQLTETAKDFLRQSLVQMYEQVKSGEITGKEFVKDFGELYLKHISSVLEVKISSPRMLEGICVDIMDVAYERNIPLKYDKKKTGVTEKVKVTGNFFEQNREHWKNCDVTLNEIERPLRRMVLFEFGIESDFIYKPSLKKYANYGRENILKEFLRDKSTNQRFKNHTYLTIDEDPKLISRIVDHLQEALSNVGDLLYSKQLENRDHEFRVFCLFMAQCHEIIEELENKSIIRTPINAFETIAEMLFNVKVNLVNVE